MKTCSAKAAEIMNKMVVNQYSTGGENGGKHATRRAAQSGLVLAEEMISHLDVDGISYWGRYWRGVKDELLKYISNEKLEGE